MGIMSPGFGEPLARAAISGLEQWEQVVHEAGGRLRVRGGARRWRRWSLTVGGLMVVVAIGALISACLIPVRNAHRSERCQGNLRQIATALLAYQEAHGGLPAAAITDGRGRNLLSWRVAILPYLGRGDLYEQFHLDEPWDSPHNRSLIARMPEVFACPAEPGLLAKGATSYKVIYGRDEDEFSGPKPMFERARKTDLREAIDGLNNTLLVVETAHPVAWTRPDDLYFADDRPIPRFGSAHPARFHAAFADGTVRGLRYSTDPQTLRAIITRDGGELSGG